MYPVLPVVRICDNTPTTLSTDVAAFFEKRHDDIIKKIRFLIRSLYRLRNFAETMPGFVNPRTDKTPFFEETVVRRENPKGGRPIETPAYRMTRDGFALLAMGFTGEKALQFKLAYIEAFNRMEARLRDGGDTITPAEQLEIRNAIAVRARTNARSYQYFYRQIYDRFQISRYTQLKRSELPEALALIEACGKHSDRVPQLPAGTAAVSREDLEAIRDFVYCFKYLFRRPLAATYQMLDAVGSPLAGRFYGVLNGLYYSGVEKVLDKNGLSVSELPTYKALQQSEG